MRRPTLSSPMGQGLAQDRRIHFVFVPMHHREGGGDGWGHGCIKREGTSEAGPEALR